MLESVIGARQTTRIEADCAAIIEAAFQRGERRLGAFLVQMVGDRALAEDLLQDTFHDAYRAARRMRAAEIENPDAWLFGIARHRALNALHRRRRFVDAFDRPRQRPPEPVTEDDELLALRDLVEHHLNPDERALVILRYVREFNASELAVMTRQTPDAIRKRLSRALASSGPRHRLLDQRDHQHPKAENADGFAVRDSHRPSLRSGGMGRLAALALISAIAVACAGAHATPATVRAAAQPMRARTGFVPASRSLLAACRMTAHAVGYRVPCPTQVPVGLTPTGAVGPTGCTLHIIGAGGVGGCATGWLGWVIGSSTTVDQHLVITASPTALHNYAKVVNGPAWSPAQRVKPLALLNIKDWRVRAVFVPDATNEGSAFMHHVVFIWTVGHHTYGVGFHDVRGVEQTLRLDRELVARIKLIGP